MAKTKTSIQILTKTEKANPIPAYALKSDDGEKPNSEPRTKLFYYTANTDE